MSLTNEQKRLIEDTLISLAVENEELTLSDLQEAVEETVQPSELKKRAKSAARRAYFELEPDLGVRVARRLYESSGTSWFEFEATRCV